MFAYYNSVAIEEKNTENLALPFIFVIVLNCSPLSLHLQFQDVYKNSKAKFLQNFMVRLISTRLMVIL